MNVVRLQEAAELAKIQEFTRLAGTRRQKQRQDLQLQATRNAEAARIAAEWQEAQEAEAEAEEAGAEAAATADAQAMEIAAATTIQAMHRGQQVRSQLSQQNQALVQRRQAFLLDTSSGGRARRVTAMTDVLGGASNDQEHQAIEHRAATRIQAVHRGQLARYAVRLRVFWRLLLDDETVCEASPDILTGLCAAGADLKPAAAGADGAGGESCELSHGRGCPNPGMTFDKRRL